MNGVLLGGSEERQDVLVEVSMESDLVVGFVLVSKVAVVGHNEQGCLVHSGVPLAQVQHVLHLLRGQQVDQQDITHFEQEGQEPLM